ncbi:chaperonin 10-like protein [Cyathus striatus]|nr:chaperonin 10-like protein [Cyathus striatus]
MASQQKALFLNGVGDEFTLKTTEIYKPASGELLIKIKSAALNPIDWKLQKYNFGLKNFPLIIGCDAAGDVVEIGEGVQGFVKGDKVIFDGNLKDREDVFQQYAVSPAFRVAKIPSGWSYDQASTIPTGLITAWIGLYHKVPYGFGFAGPTDPGAAGKYANTPLVILGGATSVAQYTIQLAQYSGFSPIIATASTKHEAYLKSLGATHITDRNIALSDLPSHIAKITVQPINLVLDSVCSAETQQAGYDLLSEGGKILVLNPNLVKEAEGKGKRFMEVDRVCGGWTYFVPGGLNGIVDGLKRLENNQVSGVKLVVHPEETA